MKSRVGRGSSTELLAFDQPADLRIAACRSGAALATSISWPRRRASSVMSILSHRSMLSLVFAGRSLLGTRPFRRS